MSREGNRCKKIAAVHGKSSNGTRGVTEGEADRSAAGGEIQNALSRLNIFKMKQDNDQFLIVTRELMT